MKEITYGSVIERLERAIPEFHPDEEDVRDLLAHLVFGDLTRFVKRLVETNDNDQLLNRIFGFIEDLARSGDSDVLDLVVESFLEGLADSPAHLDKTKRHMGTITLKLLTQTEPYLNT